MKIYRTNDEVLADVKDGMLVIEGSVTFECSIKIGASIKVAEDIVAWDIKAGDIDAGNINAVNINAWNINAVNIDARNINARNINAVNINAGNIDARNIDAWNINAVNINFFGVCFAYVSFVCKSIVSRREKSKYFCLDSEVKIKGSQMNKLDADKLVESGACCSHLTVKWQTETNDGLTHGWWACQNCGALFNPVALVKEQGEEAQFSLKDYINYQMDWSKATFGGMPRHEGICKHIEKELAEIRAKPHDLKEWVDVIILALDGAWRQGYSAETILATLHTKQQENFDRDWPTEQAEDMPTEHIRKPPLQAGDIANEIGNINARIRDLLVDRDNINKRLDALERNKGFRLREIRDLG